MLAKVAGIFFVHKMREESPNVRQNHRDDYPAPEVYRRNWIDAWTPPDLATLGGTAARHLPGYYGMVKRLDEALGRLLDTLRSLQMDTNTILLFTSDHGCHFKTRIGLNSYEDVKEDLRRRLLRRIEQVENVQPKILAADSRPAGQRRPYLQE